MPLDRSSLSFSRMRKDAQVEFRGFFGVAIEPKERRKFIHGWHGPSRGGHFIGPEG